MVPPPLYLLREQELRVQPSRKGALSRCRLRPGREMYFHERNVSFAIRIPPRCGHCESVRHITRQYRSILRRTQEQNRSAQAFNVALPMIAIRLLNSIESANYEVNCC